MSGPREIDQESAHGHKEEAEYAKEEEGGERMFEDGHEQNSRVRLPLPNGLEMSRPASQG